MRRRRSRGFTMIELMISVVVIGTVVAMAVIEMQPQVQQSRANAGMAEVMSIFRQAQAYAVANRRYVEVTFPNYPGATANQIQVTIKNSLTPNAGADVVFGTYTLEGSVYFQLMTGMPDTPDAFGHADAIEFEGVSGGPASGLFFQPDGTFDDSTGTAANGTLFLGVNGYTSTARAITILGATGRVKCYRGNPTNGWIQSY
jgi:prepilin-type N-terminal cleavage/methylation domain-containing protein